MAGATLGARSASLLPEREGPAYPPIQGRSTLTFPPTAAPAILRGSSTGGRAGPATEGPVPAASWAADVAGRLAAGGLGRWESLRSGPSDVPFSRQSSPTPPMSEQQEVPAGGAAGRRGSWAGLPHWPN